MAAVPQSLASHLMLVGISHRSATAALRDLLFANDFDQPRLLAQLQTAGITEAVVFSTCERIEVLAANGDIDLVTDALVTAIASQISIDHDTLRAQCTHHQGVDAARRLFAIASSLDSDIIGEPQVLGQVKESHRLAAAIGMTGPILEASLQAAYSVAKRVRNETSLAEQPVSIATAALRVGRDIHGDLSRRSVLIVGSGEMGEILAAEMKDAGVTQLVVLHQTLRRAESIAQRLSCHFRPWEELADALTNADIVVASVGSGRYSLTAGAIELALKRRRRRPIFFIDAAVPSDVDPAAADIDGAFVYDLGDLERVAHYGKAKREAAMVAAWRIVEQELAAFLRQHDERAAVPSVTALRRHFEAARDQILADGKLDAAAATRLLINRLLHDPAEVLRDAAADDQITGASLEHSVKRLFRVGTGHPDDSEKDRQDLSKEKLGQEESGEEDKD